MSCWSTGWPGALSAVAGQCWSGHTQGTHVAIYTLTEHSRRHHNEYHAGHHCGYQVCSGSHQDATQPSQRQLGNKLLLLLHYAAEALLLVWQRQLSSQRSSAGLGHGHSLKLRQHSDVQPGGGSPSPQCSDKPCTTQHITEGDVTTIYSKMKPHLAVHHSAHCSVNVAQSLLTAQLAT